MNRVVECVEVAGRGLCTCRKLPCFALAQPKAMEAEGRQVEGRQEVGVEGGTQCDGWRKEMRDFICIQMVCITFRSHSRFEAQVATLGVWTFPRLRDCILLCNHRPIGNRAGRSFGHLIYSFFSKGGLTTPKPFSTDVCPTFR